MRYLFLRWSRSANATASDPIKTIPNGEFGDAITGICAGSRVLVGDRLAVAVIVGVAVAVRVDVGVFDAVAVSVGVLDAVTVAVEVPDDVTDGVARGV